METQRHRTGSPERGFTLIEVVMVIVLLAIVGAFAGTLLFQGARSFELMDTRGELTAEGTLAMERISRELHLIGCTTAGSSCAPQATDITAMTATELRFVKTDLQGSGIRLNAGAVKLRQGSGATDPEDVLAASASSLAFEYLKRDGTTAVLVPDLWRINVTLVLASGAESVTFKTSVHPRSFL
ncbi:MAG: type II secretion system protein J [Thermodesulfobacteriota bacterium]